MNIFDSINKKKIFIFIILIIFIVCIGIILFNGDKSVNNSEMFRSEYEKLNNKVTDDGKEYPKVELSDDNRFVYVDVDDVLEVFNTNSDGVIYLGYADCIYCRSVVQVLNDTVMKTNLEKVYYIDMEKKSSKYDKLKEILGNELINEDGEIYVPLVLFIVDGDVVSYNTGTLFSHVDPFSEMDASQVEGLSNIYSYGIDDVLQSINKKKNNT